MVICFKFSSTDNYFEQLIRDDINKTKPTSGVTVVLFDFLKATILLN